MRSRCVPTVRCDRYSRSPISRLDRPSAASLGDLQFLCGQYVLRVSFLGLDPLPGRPHIRACSAQLRAPIRSKVIWAERSGSRACVTRRWRRSHRP